MLYKVYSAPSLVLYYFVVEVLAENELLQLLPDVTIVDTSVGESPHSLGNSFSMKMF